jgi:hypothetical protein
MLRRYFSCSVQKTGMEIVLSSIPSHFMFLRLNYVALHLNLLITCSGDMQQRIILVDMEVLCSSFCSTAPTASHGVDHPFGSRALNYLVR